MYSRMSWDQMLLHSSQIFPVEKKKVIGSPIFALLYEIV